MRQHHLMLSAVSLIVLGFSAVPVSALSMAAPALPANRPFLVPIVIVGTVSSLETDSVEAEPFPNAPKPVAFRVAIVKIDKALKGAEGLTHLRVGFIPPPPPQSVAPATPGQPVFARPRLPMAPPGPQLKEKQVACLFLTKHPKENFYIFRYDSPPLYADAPTYTEEFDAVKQALAVVAEPLPALTSKDPAHRYFAAATLVAQYRSIPEMPRVNGRPVTPKQTAISAEESRLILKILNEQDNWTPPGRRLVYPPSQLVHQLGLTADDGWT